MASNKTDKKKEKEKLPPLAKTKTAADYDHVGLTNLAKQYGPIFRVDFGSWKVVVLNSYDVMKEAFVVKGNIFGGRPYDNRDKLINPNHPNILGIQSGSYGEEWKAQRTTTVKLLHRLGFGKEKSQRVIQQEANKLVQHFKALQGQPTDPTDPIHQVVANVVSDLVFAETFPIGDEENLKLINNVFLIAELYTKNEEEDYSYFPIKSKAYKETIKKFTQTGKEINNYVLAKIKERENNFDIEKEPKDFIEAYMVELKQGEKIEREQGGTTIKENWLLNIIEDLMGAGFESTGVILRWTILYMLHFPSVMRKVQEEVDAVCGVDKLVPDFNDRTKMPYTMAVIYEILRHTSTAQFTLPHETMEDVMLGDYFIPKQTEIWGNLYAVLHDETVYPDPHEFKPDRFIDEKGELFKPPQWIPFSMGRRGCMGELLARTEIFLYFTALVRAFDISPSSESSIPSLEPVKIFVLHPQKYQCRFTSRF